ncbi:MAG: hypothetical protein IKW58_03490 [Alphaproteobacteria bacterium]|nr:hypothetical protein [Alphaproteobacteria bacterium]
MFDIVWAGILAFFLTKLIIAVDAEKNISEMFYFPEIINLIHGLGMSVKVITFIILTAILYFTNIAKILGNLLLWLIGLAYWLVIAGLIIIVAYNIIIWVAGAL